MFLGLNQRILNFAWNVTCDKNDIVFVYRAIEKKFHA
jgi:hypothetical protein